MNLPYEELYCTLLFLSTCIAVLMQLDMLSAEPAPSPHGWEQEAVQKQEAAYMGLNLYDLIMT